MQFISFDINISSLLKIKTQSQARGCLAMWGHKCRPGSGVRLVPFSYNPIYLSLDQSAWLYYSTGKFIGITIGY